MTTFLLLRGVHRSCFCFRRHRRSISRLQAGFTCSSQRFRFGFAAPYEVTTSSADAPAAATTVAQRSLFRRSSAQGADSIETTGPTVSASVSPGSQAPPTAKPPSDRISTRTRRHTATAAGNAPLTVDYGVGPGSAPRSSATRANTRPRVPRPRQAPPTAVTPSPSASPVPTVQIPSNRDHAEPVELLFYGFRLLLATRPQPLKI